MLSQMKRVFTFVVVCSLAALFLSACNSKAKEEKDKNKGPGDRGNFGKVTDPKTSIDDFEYKETFNRGLGTLVNEETYQRVFKIFIGSGRLNYAVEHLDKTQSPEHPLKNDILTQNLIGFLNDSRCSLSRVQPNLSLKETSKVYKTLGDKCRYEISSNSKYATNFINEDVAQFDREILIKNSFLLKDQGSTLANTADRLKTQQEVIQKRFKISEGLYRNLEKRTEDGFLNTIHGEMIFKSARQSVIDQTLSSQGSEVDRKVRLVSQFYLKTKQETNPMVAIYTFHLKHDVLDNVRELNCYFNDKLLDSASCEWLYSRLH